MGVVEDTKKRAEAGKESLESKKAESARANKGKEANESAEDVLKQLDELAAKSQAPARDHTPGVNSNNPVPAAERSTTDLAPAATAQLATAAAAVAHARQALVSQMESDARLTSDPRYERDQKIFEMGKAGKLGMVPPTEAEKAAQAARTGLSPEVLQAIPSTPSEQVADDMKRLKEGEERAKTLNPVITAGEQDGAPKNNFTEAKRAGANTGDRVPKDEADKKFETGERDKNVIK